MPSDMIWLPQQNVGLAIVTNGDPGWLLRDRIRRKLLEVLFDGLSFAKILAVHGMRNLGRLCQEDAKASCYMKDEGKVLRGRSVKRSRSVPITVGN